VALLQDLVDILLPTIVAVLNGQLSSGFPLPPIPGIAFQGAAALELEQGFAVFGANFTYTPSVTGVFGGILREEPSSHAPQAPQQQLAL